MTDRRTAQPAPTRRYKKARAAPTAAQIHSTPAAASDLQESPGARPDGDSLLLHPFGFVEDIVVPIRCIQAAHTRIVVPEDAQRLKPGALQLLHYVLGSSEIGDEPTVCRIH